MKLKQLKEAVFKKRRILNPRKDEDLVILLARERAMQPPGFFERKFAEQAERDAAKRAREALKKGGTPTVESLIKVYDESAEKFPLVAEFYAGLGFKRDFFVGLAETAIKDGGRMEDMAKPAKVGRNDLCPCGSGKKYKRCCGG